MAYSNCGAPPPGFGAPPLEGHELGAPPQGFGAPPLDFQETRCNATRNPCPSRAKRGIPRAFTLALPGLGSIRGAGFYMGGTVGSIQVAPANNI